MNLPAYLLSTKRIDVRKRKENTTCGHFYASQDKMFMFYPFKYGGYQEDVQNVVFLAKHTYCPSILTFHHRPPAKAYNWCNLCAGTTSSGLKKIIEYSVLY